MITTRRRFASLIAFSAAVTVLACGGDVLLPSDGTPATITIMGGNGQSGPAGTALDAPLVVQVKDAGGRAVEGRAIAFTIDAGGGQVAPASAQTGADGQASANWTLGAPAGEQRVQAKVTGSDVPATLLVKFSATAVSGAGSVLGIASGDNQTAPVLSALGDSLVVEVADALGNPVAGVEVQWTAIGGGSVSPGTVVTGANGLAATERVLGAASGTQTAEASSAGLTTVTFTQTAIAANPTVLKLVSGDGQSGPVGAPLTDSLVVRLEDDNGNGVGGKAITWVPGPGAGTPHPVNSTTNVNGFAKTEWTLGATTGTKLLSAVFSGLPSVPFVATAGAGAATKLVFTQVPVNTRAGATITPSVKVAIQDASGNTVTSAQDAVTLAIGANPSGGTLGGTLTVAAVNGVATFGDLSIDKAGPGYTLVASAGALTGATSAGFDVLPGNASRLVFIVGPGARVVGQTFSPAIQVQVQDAGGNPVLTASNTITIGSSVAGTLSGNASQTPFLGTATFSNLALTKAGVGYVLTAHSSGLVDAASDPFDVTQGATTIAIGNRSPGSSVPGQNVTVNYDINVTAPAAGSLTGGVTVSDGTTSCNGGVNAGTGIGSCTLAFPDAGSHQLTATYSGDANFQGSASAPVDYTVNQAPTTLAITQDTPDPSVLGDPPVTVHWNLTSTGSGALTGTVTLSAGGPDTCSAAASLGAGQCDLPFSGANGSRPITASYAGDANFKASTDNEPHTVLGQTATTVNTSGTPTTAGQSVTFTAHVSVVSGSGSLGGTVQFFDGTAQIGSDGLNGSGDATLSTNALAVGPHSIAATYQGSNSFASSTSSALTQMVDVVANVSPTAVDDPSYSVQEDGTLNVGPGNNVLKNDGDPDGGPQPLTARNASMPAHGTVALASNGTFTYTPEADYNGTDSFTYEAFDGADAATATVTISITAVNDAPSFTKGGDQSASLLGLAQTMPGWATDISAGPANESSQTVQFDVSTSDDSQFLLGLTPQVSGTTGTLTYTPNLLGSPGAVTVTVRARDDGGTGNGGVNVSADQTFTITLTP